MGGEGSLRAVRLWPTPETGSAERELLEAVLAAVGEHGYGGATLRDVLKRSGFSHKRFRQHFASLDACFAAAYAVEAERLADDVLAAGRSEDGWRDGFRAGLGCFLDRIAKRPLLAKVLLIEGGPGSPGATKHFEVAARLADAVDAARKEIDPRRAPPPLTSRLIVGAIESSAAKLIVAGEAESAGRRLPELMHFATLLFFGREAADRELDQG
jgi:AcrR family transcriptional regulator